MLQQLFDLELMIPPSFFDVMTHLVIHLVEVLDLCGPVHIRWMNFFLKGYVWCMR
jgi:hypothetical protein